MYIDDAIIDIAVNLITADLSGTLPLEDAAEDAGLDGDDTARLEALLDELTRADLRPVLEQAMERMTDPCDDES